MPYNTPLWPWGLASRQYFILPCGRASRQQYIQPCDRASWQYFIWPCGRASLQHQQCYIQPCGLASRQYFIRPCGCNSRRYYIWPCCCASQQYYIQPHGRVFLDNIIKFNMPLWVILLNLISFSGNVTYLYLALWPHLMVHYLFNLAATIIFIWPHEC